MAGITPSVGLITGVPIQETIDQLMEIAARPKSLLQSRNAAAQQEQGLLAKIQSMVLSLRISTQQLAKPELFSKQQAASSQPAALTASVTGSPPSGQFRLTPLRLAEQQQLLSSAFTSKDATIGAGEVSFRFGGFVDQGISLANLNGGSGVERGKIRLTDRSGETTEIDLRYAQTVDDVIEAINSQADVQITADTDGDRIRLTDHTGMTTSNLRVQEVSGGTTAAGLGLSGIDVGANTASGSDVVRLYDALELDRLNGGTGVQLRAGLPDLQVSLRDGTSVEIDFADETTVGQLLETINAAAPTKLHAQIAAGGDRLELTDLSTDTGGTFAVTSPLGGELAADLGLEGTAVGGVLTGERLMAGLRTSLLRNLNGGQGIGGLGLLTLTDRSGASASIDLSTATSLDDVLTAINSANVGIEARINKSRNGIELIDTTGSTTSSLIVANGDGTNTADKLQITASTTSTSIDSGSLKLQVVGDQTRLDSWNGGQGITRNSVLITDSNGQAGILRLKDEEYQTIGDVIDGINALTIGVEARINDAGDGILVYDTAGGSRSLEIRDVGVGHGAKDLGIAGTGTTQNVGGTDRSAIDGSSTFTLALEADETLEDFVTRVNELGVGIRAGLMQETSGSSSYRLSLTSERSGLAGAIQFDTEISSLKFSELTRAQDALISYGSTNPATGFLVTSNTNNFSEVVSGLNVTIHATSDTPVTLTVSNNPSDVIDNIKKFVADYNTLRGEIDKQTAFDAATGTSGPLSGSAEVLRIESDLTRIFSSRVFGAGDIQSLEELGIGVDDQGKLRLDEAELRSRLTADPDAVNEFFTQEDFGVAVRLTELIDRLAGTPKVDGKPQGKSLLDLRFETLRQRMDSTQERIDRWDERLADQRERLLKQFTAMEAAVAKMQSALSQLARIQPVTMTSSN